MTIIAVFYLSRAEFSLKIPEKREDSDVLSPENCFDDVKSFWHIISGLLENIGGFLHNEHCIQYEINFSNPFFAGNWELRSFVLNGDGRVFNILDLVQTNSFWILRKLLSMPLILCECVHTCMHEIYCKKISLAQWDMLCGVWIYLFKVVRKKRKHRAWKAF